MRIPRIQNIQMDWLMDLFMETHRQNIGDETNYAS